ncbi:MAG: carbohydrate kinase family protein [Candidatus Heimdallarchaeota archaeon]|nr:carbohydrate kinase family protein [Candidatus Heimdallarchaeota archaeon]
MLNDEIIYGGFDLSFVDINIRPLDANDNLIDRLPDLGSHHTKTDIEFIPGGNGFNFCRTLANLGRKVTFVGASSDFFENLVSKNKIPLKIEPIDHAKVNYTSILNLNDGEIQFNSTKYNLSPDHLTEHLVSIYRGSKLKHISNIALNSTSIEWISSLLLCLVDPEHPYVFDSNIDINSKINLFHDINFEGIMFIDPSDISHYERLADLVKILKITAKLSGEKYLSLNEHELLTLKNYLKKSPQEIADFLKIPIIFHTSDSVKFYGKENYELKTKNIVHKKTFVGAGDCFNGSFLHQILNSSSVVDSLEFAIKSASYLIETSQYPTQSTIY